MNCSFKSCIILEGCGNFHKASYCFKSKIMNVATLVCYVFEGVNRTLEYKTLFSDRNSNIIQTKKPHLLVIALIPSESGMCFLWRVQFVMIYRKLVNKHCDLSLWQKSDVVKGKQLYYSFSYEAL